MKFLADECVDRQIVDVLRKIGFQVQYVAEMNPGISDTDVLESANRESAVLLTTDKDFGELVFRQRLLMQGVILVRLAGLSPDRKAEMVSSAVSEHQDKLHDAFTVITPGIIRIRSSG